MRNMPVKIARVCLMLVLATACGKKLPEQTVTNKGVPRNVALLLPRNVNNAEREPAVLKPSSAIISVPIEEEFYFGSDRFPQDELGDKLSRVLEGQNAADKIVYVAAGYSVDFANVVRILNEARKQGVVKAGLLVDQSDGDVPHLFRIQVPVEPDSEDVLSELKPDPNILVVSIDKDLKMELNRQPMGETSDTSKLTQTLMDLFQKRNQARVYKPGMETRTDLPESERVERTVVVKSQRSTRYGQVVLAIDAIKGAGANPIVLQIDDLSE
jgi:biopolymer transport protein ExbD/biopolymer transport protein TolR